MVHTYNAIAHSADGGRRIVSLKTNLSYDVKTCLKTEQRKKLNKGWETTNFSKNQGPDQNWLPGSLSSLLFTSLNPTPL